MCFLTAFVFSSWFVGAFFPAFPKMEVIKFVVFLHLLLETVRRAAGCEDDETHCHARPASASADCEAAW